MKRREEEDQKNENITVFKKKQLLMPNLPSTSTIRSRATSHPHAQHPPASNTQATELTTELNIKRKHKLESEIKCLNEKGSGGRRYYAYYKQATRNSPPPNQTPTNLSSNNQPKSSSFNIIVNQHLLKDMITTNLVCKACEENRSEQMLEEFAEHVKNNRECNVTSLLKHFKEKNKKRKKLTFVCNTVGISSSLTCMCEDGCKYTIPHETVTWEEKTRKDASENYGLNIRYVLAMQQVGCCGTEADVIMSF